ncbi:MAG: acyl-CoA thioesterase [Bilifractor sp.]|jgi:acyl-CoA thioester hydrolase
MNTEGIRYTYLCYPRFEDTDAYGILHHSRYLIFVEEAKLAFMSDAKYFGTQIMEMEDCRFPVTEVKMRYVSAVRYHSGVPVKVQMVFRIDEFARVIFQFQIYYEGRLSAKGYAIHVLADRKGHLRTEMPPELTERYLALKGEENDQDLCVR